MKKNIIYLLLFLVVPGIVLFHSCKHKIKVIPEITSHLVEEKVQELKDKEFVGKIIKKQDKLIFISLKGEVSRFDPASNILDFLSNLNTPIEPHIFVGDPFILLKKKDSARFILFDSQEMRVASEFKLKAVKINQVVGLQEKLLIYKQKKEIIFYDTVSGSVISKIKLAQDDVIHSCEISGASILILTTSKLYTYSNPGGKPVIASEELKAPASSGFLMDGEYLYYGSSNRKLVKMLARNCKIAWSYKLPKRLTLEPQKVGHYIAITPDDNNIYFFNQRGTLHWWEKFEAPRALPPVVMKDNIAVFLMNRVYRDMNNKIKFFNYKKKEVTNFELQYRIDSAPIYIDDSLFILGETKIDNKPARYLVKLGNRYNADIEISPEYIKPLKKSIIFTIKPVNLIEPGVKVTIFDSEKKIQYEKQIGKPGDLYYEFVWMPEKAGLYRLVVHLDAENKKGIEVEKTFRVEDIDSVVERYYYEVQLECPAEFPKTPAPSQKETVKEKKEAPKEAAEEEKEESQPTETGKKKTAIKSQKKTKKPDSGAVKQEAKKKTRKGRGKKNRKKAEEQKEK